MGCGFGHVVNEVSVEVSERRDDDEKTVGVGKQAARPDADVVILEQGAAGPPQDGEQSSWSVGLKLARSDLPPPQAWN